MPTMPAIPDDVVAWINKVFNECNEKVSRKISRIPTSYETALDQSFIEALSTYAVPMILGSGWTVRIDTHFLGGGRHFGSWEIADIGFIVMFRHAGRLVRSKVGLLQSKRLYPDEQKLEEDTAQNYLIGFGGLLESDETYLQVTKPRKFSFSKKSRYKKLIVGDDQYKAIEKYEKKFDIPVHYLLYNPLRVPSSTVLPRHGTRGPRGPCSAGCRVTPSAAIRQALAQKNRPNKHIPSYGELEFGLGSPFDTNTHIVGWRLEHFVSQLLIMCHEGYIAENREDEGLRRVFNRRTGPIPAAVAVTFDAPD